MKLSKRTGCDYCGEAKPVKKSKSHYTGQFQKVYLCSDCSKVLKIKN